MKYLGVVDGSMGILSHKAVMRDSGILAVNRQSSSLIGLVQDDSKNLLNRYGPVLNGKNYAAERLKR